MDTPLESVPLLWLWIGFLVLMLASIAAIFVWAVRTRQFRDQDRARHLPQESGIPPGPAPRTGRAP